MIRDVLIASMNKGQFIPALVAISFITMLIRMPAEGVERLAFQILFHLEKWDLIGYVLTVMALSGWAFHAKWQRRVIHSEMERLSEERNRLQAEATTAAIESTTGRKSKAARKGRT